MSAHAFLLVIAGAICHAIWNVIAKKAGGGLVFVWMFGLVSVAAAVPLAAWAWMRAPQVFDARMWLAALASGLVHVVYSLVLQKAYRKSDFAVVYPVARGSGPMLSVAAAMLILDEAPSVAGGLAVALILLGVFVSAGARELLRGKPTPMRQRGVAWGLFTGAFIAAYTLLDGWAIKALGMAPILFYAVGLVFRSVLLTPFACRRKEEWRGQWLAHRRAILAVGLLSPTAYLLVLFAVREAPLSYVAPVREISMLIGTFIGAQKLKEAVTPSQALGAAIMLLGVIGLAWA